MNHEASTETSNIVRLRSLARILARVFALDLDLYRDAYSLVVAQFAPLLGLSKSGVELYLRGLTFRKLSGGKKVYIGRNVVFIGTDRISLGENCKLYGFDYLNADTPWGYIRIGQNTHIDVFCVLYGQGGLSIGDNCAIASGVKVYSQSNQYKQNPGQKIIEQPVVYNEVKIGDDVWIGANAVILPGIQIGDSSIVGAGAVVRQDVPPYAIVAGIPAKIVGWRKIEEAKSGL